jgi:hypothetical protein
MAEYHHHRWLHRRWLGQNHTRSWCSSAPGRGVPRSATLNSATLSRIIVSHASAITVGCVGSVGMGYMYGACSRSVQLATQAATLNGRDVQYPFLLGAVNIACTVGCDYSNLREHVVRCCRLLHGCVAPALERDVQHPVLPLQATIFTLNLVLL